MVSKIVISLLLLIVVSFSSLKAQEGKGVAFFDGSIQEAFFEAQDQGKLVFVDAYAKWCSPCNKMRKVLASERLGKLYNEKFISVSVNMGSPFGRAFGKKYKITEVPTIMYFDGNGNLISSYSGYRGTKKMMSLGRRASVKK